jgi:hypothetical protein
MFLLLLELWITVNGWARAAMLSFVRPPILSQLSTYARHLKIMQHTNTPKPKCFFLLFGFLSYYYVRYKLLHFDENFLGLIFKSYPTRRYLTFFFVCTLFKLTWLMSLIDWLCFHCKCTLHKYSDYTIKFLVNTNRTLCTFVEFNFWMNETILFS